MTPRRALLALALLPVPALAQRPQAQFNRPIRLVVPFAPGGNSDTLARLIQPRMSAFLGQQIVVENRSGAGGAIGAAQVVQAPADGHTLLFDSASFVVAQFIHRNLSFDYERDFAPVGTVADVPYLLGVARSRGITDVASFLAAARAAPGGLSYGSPGVGSIGHLAGVMLAHRSGVRLEHVPYRGGAEAARDLASGTLDAAIISGNSLNPLVEGGRAVVAGTTNAAGIGSHPSIASQGFAGFDLTSWNALFCRTGTPEPVRRTLEEAVNHATSDAEVKARYAAAGADATPAEADALGARLVRERALVRDLIRETGITLG
ncbi:twin-arginine translocation pathway signal protein [Roseomonas stagni]|uniref:Twin-arginine translocation pathway signal protein n=1 Tax=Falsiroseomonas algicola TaxID=2716930 RepID=A0A6M1LLU9_9PROT|nr:tripartite tricarboxylate transporter substrate-binding protein [Falsiroseomonas algicola]NGM21177.1 twin-arginine translocation pathway signal protein [Falsiroseomonas algicola]